MIRDDYEVGNGLPRNGFLQEDVMHPVVGRPGSASKILRLMPLAVGVLV